MHKNEGRFQLFEHEKISHYRSKQDKDLSWTMTQSMCNSIGEKIINKFSEKHPDSIVQFGNADEVPSAQSLQWLTYH